jgi:5-hydroxyisourate hydrolase
MSTISTHVLDTSRGRPGDGIPVRLLSTSGTDVEVASGVTDADGRVMDLGPERLPEGTYRLVFETTAYFARHQQAAFFPAVEIVFTVADSGEHYHVPVLLSPFAFSTYRGS